MAQQEPRRPSPFGEGSDGLGYPTGGPPPGTAPRATPPTPPRPPGLATAAAVLGFVDAALYGLIATWVVIGTAVLGGATSGELAFGLVLVLALTGLSALLAVGSLRLLRGSDRRLLDRASIAQLAGLVVVLALASLTEPERTVVALAEGVVLGVAVAVVRLALGTRPSVNAWLATGAGPEDGVLVRALLTPHALLVAATLLVFWHVVPADPYADAAEHEVYGITDWSYLYAGGDPVPPPGTVDAVWDGDVSGDAGDCHDGSMAACDDLAADADPGTPYEWLGTTCGGRLAQPASYPCVDELPDS